ncbi:MAG: hypothetical protein ACRDOS_06825 [Gaiellaceae bacterium]
MHGARLLDDEAGLLKTPEAADDLHQVPVFRLRGLVEPEPLAQNLSDRPRAWGGIGGTVELLGLPLRCRGNRLKQLLVRELEPCRRLRLGLGVQLVDAAGRPRRNGAPCVFRKVQDGLRPAN